MDAVKEFYYNNIDNCSLRIFYDRNENGLAMIYKNKEFASLPNQIQKIWNYNPLIKIIYPYLKKIFRIFKSLFK